MKRGDDNKLAVGEIALYSDSINIAKTGAPISNITDLDSGKLRNNPTSGHISEFIHPIPSEILAYPEDSNEFAMKLRINRAIVLSSLVTTNLLIICGLRNSFIYKYLEI